MAHGRLSLDLVEPNGPVHESARDHRGGAFVSLRRNPARLPVTADGVRRSKA
ncbi:MAG: hypothetical protein OXQ84_13715 [bacterium]|nr:hypothetical protein [bacterium]